MTEGLTEAALWKSPGNLAAAAMSLSKGLNGNIPNGGGTKG